MQNKGIIIGNISNLYMVEVFDSDIKLKCTARGKFKEQNITPTVGDHVELELINEEKCEGTIGKILDRSNYIKRPKMANITQLAFIISMKMPKPDLLMLDKQLAFAEFNKIKAIICLNKTDLVHEEEIDAVGRIYSDIGYTVIKTNAKNGEGVDLLKQHLENNVTVFSGNSGVGKSTLINNIFSEVLTLEGNISEKNKKGKNTTTNTYLYKINKNSYIADTPGFSTFDVNEISSNELFKYFIDLVKFEKDCEYVGCTHIKEECCGIKKALKDGKISKSRYDNFCKIYLDLKDKEDHKW